MIIVLNLQILSGLIHMTKEMNRQPKVFRLYQSGQVINYVKISFSFGCK
jgi:hypothetical protein